MRNPDGTPKGCAFVKFAVRTAAIAAIEALHEKCTMDVSISISMAVTKDVRENCFVLW